MSVTPHAAAETARTPEEGGEFDVVIIGAGISGLGAAYRITERNPGTSYVILERREQIGGTWDLFRYPGVRSDSSIFTLCFPYEPWTRKEGVADGAHIRKYLNTTAHKYGIDQHIRFNTHVRSADWDSSSDTWTVTAEHDGAEKTYRGRFVFFGSGYYNYDEGYTPDFPGLDEFDGTVVHPQHWPEDLDYRGKRVVVIGSGATAVTLIPSLAFDAKHVTMLQRSPSYVASLPAADPIASSPAEETDPRCRSLELTKTLRPGAASSSSPLVGSLPSGQLHRATFQNSSHGACGDAVPAVRTARSASASPRQSHPSPPRGIQAACDKCTCTSTNPGSR